MSSPLKSDTSEASRTVNIAGPDTIPLGSKEFITLMDAPYADVIMRLPLPGIIIFVHGVNSDGEWYGAAEQGLCAGLNERLRRRNEDLAHPTREGGQLAPVSYLSELTPDGFINPRLQFDTFINGFEHYSPVIHFRWGYKANSEDLQKFGDSIYLNEHNYWGGGPFANGCSALPDLWGSGLSDSLFLWMQIQHLNPVNERVVYACPHRGYYVLAALRLAKLIESIRKKQADVPITVVCHSQGNMIGLAAAFLGDRLGKVTDATATAGNCVADSYVLTNPPYSLVKSNFTDNWTMSTMTDKKGRNGRQTGAARIQTLRAFFDLIRRPNSSHQTPHYIDKFMANKAKGFDTAADRKRYGFGPASATCGRVTLYCNPHDQVISSTTVQGIGWRGMNEEELQATAGDGVFCQRVFAQGYKVGVQGEYHYWKDHHRKIEPGSAAFWYPKSPKAMYSLTKGLDAKQAAAGKVMTVLAAPFMVVLMKFAGPSINAIPDKTWSIPLRAPDLPEPFEPESLIYGTSSKQFDEGFDAPGEQRDRERERTADDPYLGDREIDKGRGRNGRARTDAAKGDVHSEARLRYDDHARLRMQAKREGMTSKTVDVADEDKGDAASDIYKAWRSKQIKKNLADSTNAHATDHSTIMTNSLHAQKSLSYDVAVGVCHISDVDLCNLRAIADWRFVGGAQMTDPNRVFKEYFEKGIFRGLAVSEWTSGTSGEGSMPAAIADEREGPAPSGAMTNRSSIS